MDALFKRAGQSDLILLYYSGHGCIDFEGQLYLATANTMKASLLVSSISLELVRSIMRNHPSVRKAVIILDCCYSGAVEKAFLRGEAVDAQLQRVAESCGTYILTASTSTQAAQEKEGDQYGVLTKHIISGIRSGDAAGPDGLVTMDTLFRYVSEQCRQDGPQQPMKWELGVRGDDLTISKTKFYSPQGWSKTLHELRDQLPPRIYEQAQRIIEGSLDDLPPEKRGFGDLLERLVSKRLKMGVFIERWYQAETDGFVAEETNAIITSQEIVTSDGVERDSGKEGQQSDNSPGAELTLSRETQPPPLEATFDLLSSQIRTFSTELSREKAMRLEEIRELYRRGQRREAYEQMREFRNNQSWPMLEGQLRALALRVLAVMTVGVERTRGLTEAHKLLEESSGIDPTGDVASASALLRYCEEGPATAIEGLTHPSTLDAFNTRLAFLIEMNRTEEALTSIGKPPEGIAFNAETHRLWALALLASGDLEGSVKQIDDAKRDHPGWHGVRVTAAMVDYYSSLSPMAMPSYLMSYPAPIHPSLIKQDDVSQSLLKRSAEEFGMLASEFENGSEEQSAFLTWQLACLANSTGGEPAATLVCQRLLESDPASPPALAWALARNLEVDLSASEQALEEQLEEDGTG
jgi:hypothetical protein